MQTLFIFLSLMFFWANTLFAQVIPAEPIKVETLITQIKSAKPEDRRALTNQLKLKLRAMHQGDRLKAMMNLRKSLGANRARGKAQKLHNDAMRQEKANKPSQSAQRGIHKGMQKGQQKGQK